MREEKAVLLWFGGYFIGGGIIFIIGVLNCSYVILCLHFESVVQRVNMHLFRCLEWPVVGSEENEEVVYQYIHLD